MRIEYHQLHIDTGPGINLHNLSTQIRGLLTDAKIRNGFVVVTSRHTTTALTINENESRLLEDIRAFFERLVPPGDKYYHNDIELRDCPPDEPRNAHSHLIAMLLGSSEAIPVIDGELALGRWQSVLLAELDGPRKRTVAVQIVGE